jgi:flagellar hook-length control protein FliK
VASRQPVQAPAPQQPVAPQPTEKPATTDAPPANENSDALQGSKPAKVMVSPFRAQDDAAAAKGDVAATTTSTNNQTDQAPSKEKTTDSGAEQQTFARVLEQQNPASQTPAPSSAQHVGNAPVVQQQTPVQQFAQANQPSIVSTIRGSLLPDGGTMNISLNPPELGAMQISVKMENGVMSASFQTSNEQATRLLTHTLGQLKDALEIQGVSVDRLHVHQASGSDSSSNQKSDSESGGKQSSQDGRSPQQEEQRRETLRRMWRRIRGQRDPLDLVA